MTADDAVASRCARCVSKHLRPKGGSTDNGGPALFLALLPSASLVSSPVRTRVSAQGRQPYKRAGAPLVAGAAHHWQCRHPWLEHDAWRRSVGYDAWHRTGALLAQHAVRGGATHHVARVTRWR